jgi:hypothetical protein
MLFTTEPIAVVSPDKLFFNSESKSKKQRSRRKQTMQTNTIFPATGISSCKCRDLTTPACDRTRGELDTLLEKAPDNSCLSYTRYFESLTCINGKTMDHCKKCSKTIDMHVIDTIGLQTSTHRNSSPRHSSKNENSARITSAPEPFSPAAGLFPVPVLTSETDEKKLQALYQPLDQRATTETVFLVTNNKVSIHFDDEEFKPDMVIYNNSNITETGIVSVIELKSPERGHTVPPDERSEEMKQLMGYLHAILHRQQRRAFVYGLLTNHLYLVAVQALRRVPQGEIQYILHYAGSFRPEWLQFVCDSDLRTLGCSPPYVTISGTQYALHNYLGSGQYSHGYELQIADATIVVKEFATQGKADLEMSTCHALSAVKDVSKLFPIQPTETLFVAITPKGLKFDKVHPLTIEHVRGLISALRSLHVANLVHGDVCTSNIYWIDATSALLNDWSHVELSTEPNKRWKDFVHLRRAVEALGGADDLVQEVDLIVAHMNPKRPRE